MWCILRSRLQNWCFLVMVLTILLPWPPRCTRTWPGSADRTGSGHNPAHTGWITLVTVCLECISVSVIGVFSQLELDTNSGSIKEREFPTVNSYSSKIYIAQTRVLCRHRLGNLWGSSRRTWNLEREKFECCIINVTF